MSVSEPGDNGVGGPAVTAFFEGAAPGGGGSPSRVRPARARGVSPAGVTRVAAPAVQTFGRGPVPVDSRKFRYDRNRAQALPRLAFGATKADRMDADEAGDMLHRIHKMYDIDCESEDVIAAFDKALFFEHTINGASLMQPGRGLLTVGKSTFELASVKQVLGVEQRRFFRAFADEVADLNREVIASYDAYDPTTVEKHGQLMQVAIERGLQKFPYLAHDSSDAGVRVTVEERVALAASKRLVLPSVVNNADKLAARVPVVGDA